MTTTILIISALFILLFFSAIFSSAETAYSSVNPLKIEEMIQKGSKSALLIKKHYRSFGWTIATILISNNLVNIFSSSLITVLFLRVGNYDQNMVAIISTAILTPIIVVFGEIIPKLFAKKYSYGYLKYLCYLFEVLNWVFAPFTFFLSKITFSSAITNTENQIKNIVDLAKQERVIEKREASLVKNALDFDEISVKSVYVKKNDLFFASKNDSMKKVKTMFQTTNFSRLPIWDDDKKEFLGIVHLRDLVFYDDNSKIIDFLIPIPVISKNILIIKALDILRVNKKHMAFVKNASDKIVGIVTMEDVLEELIGEIYDEHDKEEEIHPIGLHKFIVNGSLQMYKLEDNFNENFFQSKGLTLKQWIRKRINRNIKKNLVYKYKKKYIFTILSNSHNKATKIQIEVK